MAEGLPGGQPERTPGFDLAGAHSFEAGAQDFGAIGAHIDGQRDQRRGVGTELDANRGEAEEDDEKLNQKRRIAYSLDIGAGGKAGRSEWAYGCDGNNEANG